MRLDIQHGEDGFLPVAAPVEPGFLLVDRGRDVADGLELTWAVSIGSRNGVDVLAFSAFALSGNARKRLAVTVAAPLATDAGPVQPGLRISHERREAALEMARMWREWLARALGER